MPETISIGDLVTTKFGEGRIVYIEGNYATVEININRIKQPLSTTKKIERTTVREDVKRQNPLEQDERVVNLRTLESLRFGLVPQGAIDRLTIGYDDIMTWVEYLLPPNNRNRPKVGAIIGNYGTGKSHLLSIIRHIARSQNYVTSNVEIDGINIRLSDPETFLSALWNQLEANDLSSSTPLLDLYIKAIKRGHPAPTIVRNGIDRINRNYEVIQSVFNRQLIDEFEEDLNAIVSSYSEYTATDVTNRLREGLNDRFVYVRRMIGRETQNRPYDFIESLFGHSKVCTLAGYSGLFITIDEFEIQMFDRIDRTRRLLEVLREYLLGQTRYPPFPCTIIFAQVPGQNNMPTQYVENLINDCKGITRVINEITQNECLELAKRIFDIYKSAYLSQEEEFNIQYAKESYNRVQGVGGRVRAFIKDYIATLDHIYYRR